MAVSSRVELYTLDRRADIGSLKPKISRGALNWILRNAKADDRAIWASKLCESINAEYTGTRRLSGTVRKLIIREGFRISCRFVESRSDIQVRVL